MPSPLVTAIVLILSVPLYICWSVIIRSHVMRQEPATGILASLLCFAILLVQSALVEPAVRRCHQFTPLSLVLLAEIFGLVVWTIYYRAKLLGTNWWQSDRDGALMRYTIRRRLPALAVIGVVIGGLQHLLLTTGIRVPPFFFVMALLTAFGLVDKRMRKSFPGLPSRR
jgi:hypothetical protein